RAITSPADRFKSKPKKVGPSVSELIVKAMAAFKERNGVSAAGLKQALAAAGYDVDKNKARVKTAFKSLVAKGTLVQTKGTGASGSFKMNKATETKAKKPAGPARSHLEVLILIPAASHSAANRSSVSWRPSPDEANRTTSSAKIRDEILRPPKRKPSATWLRLEILSIKIMNRTGDKGQPWRGPSPTGNESDLLPAMRTKLLQRLYRDRMARSNGPDTPYSRNTSHRTPRGTRSNAFSKSTKHM
uniref:Histone H1 n=1 Tax=Maylandia zebra TaxID=106582 RepID=A0A3P9C4G3_9CICH